ncbi:MAG: PDZ domain-containing protein [Labilithrix sp.]|nr:PDZ domain-containing protein [Labilithrix sp.]MCW5813429.1 PDZ domain-containing protein [Labilithrix sp.]
MSAPVSWLRRSTPIVALAAACASQPAPARVAADPAPLAARTLRDHVAELFAKRYAPRDLKARTIGWSLERELARLDEVIARPRATPEELRRAFRAFFRAPRDLHTSLELPPGRAVWLGLHLVSTDAGVRVAWIDPKLAPTLPLRVGDEVTAFDGRPIAEVHRRIAAADGYASTPDFERELADWFLTLRSSTDLDDTPAPGARARLVVRTHDPGAPARTVELTWRDADADGPSERCPLWPKTKRSVLPPPEELLWRAPDAAFYGAYAFSAAGRRYGFVRLHTYDVPPAEQPRAMREVDEALSVFLERDVDALVIDQRGNGGGNFLFAYVMLSRLFERPLVPPRQRFLIDGDEVVGFGPRAALAELGARLGGVRTDEEARATMDAIPLFARFFGFGPRDRATAQGAAAFFAFFASQPPGLTAPHFALVPEHVPERSRGPVFGKPVVMLIDGMSISAADYVPAALKDNGRVTLFGTTTSGAGGDQRRVGRADACKPGASELVRACAPPEVIAALETLGITAFNFTVTLGVRPGDRVIENVGVAPDVPYRVRADDLTTGFSPMWRAVLDAAGAGR